MKNIFGYFTDPYQTIPAYDPGFDVECPVCHQRLRRPALAISLMLDGDDRSYFYRMCKPCYESLSEDEQTVYDSVIIDAVARSKDVN